MSRPPRLTSSSPQDCSGGVFDWDVALRRLHELDARSEDPTLWDKPAEAQALMRERQQLADRINAVKLIESDLSDAVEFAEMADAEGDEASLEDARAQLKEIKARAATAELEALLSGEADGNDAYVEINSGAGGTESCDWANMLLRMYTRWATAHGYSVEIIEETGGEQVGIKSATLQVKGPNAYGWLKTEGGVHRLVRISPFDAQARRHTAFASVDATPDIDDNIEIEVSESECRIDTYRSSGAGGQHVNTTDSAVRITHLATGIVAACQAERSQHKNKAKAWKMLKAKLYQHELEKRQAEADAYNAEKKRIEWGSQIRSYVLQPYRLVKDLRTGHESGNTDKVLGGDLTPFMEAWLVARSGKGEGTEA